MRYCGDEYVILPGVAHELLTPCIATSLQDVLLVTTTVVQCGFVFFLLKKPQSRPSAMQPWRVNDLCLRGLVLLCASVVAAGCVAQQLAVSAEPDCGTASVGLGISTANTEDVPAFVHVHTTSSTVCWCLLWFMWAVSARYGMNQVLRGPVRLAMMLNGVCSAYQLYVLVLARPSMSGLHCGSAWAAAVTIAAAATSLGVEALVLSCVRLGSWVTPSRPPPSALHEPLLASTTSCRSASHPVSNCESPEAATGLLGATTFWWVVPQLLRGWRQKRLFPHDLQPLPKCDDTRALHQEFNHASSALAQGASLPGLLHRLHWRPFWASGLLLLVSRVAQFGVPIFLEKLLNRLAAGTQNTPAGCVAWIVSCVVFARATFSYSCCAAHRIGCAMGLFASSLLTTLTYHRFYYQALRVGVHASSQLVSEVRRCNVSHIHCAFHPLCASDVLQVSTPVECCKTPVSCRQGENVPLFAQYDAVAYPLMVVFIPLASL